MKHLHFDTLESTQNYIKSHFEEITADNINVLVTCDEQTQGIGRHGNIWHHEKGNLAMSFTFSPHYYISLTPIEIGVVVCEYLNHYFHSNIKLKWPNDFISENGKKVGGLICHLKSPDMIIVGIGLNFNASKELKGANFKHGVETISIPKETDLYQLSEDIYSTVLKNRLIDPYEVTKKFEQLCYHMNSQVEISDHLEVMTGMFKGINFHGEALIASNNLYRSFLSGHLQLLDRT